MTHDEPWWALWMHCATGNGGWGPESAQRAVGQVSAIGQIEADQEFETETQISR